MTWSLRRKLVIGFLAVILPQAGALSLVSYLHVRELVKIHEQLTEISSSLQATARLNLAVNRMTLPVHDYIIGRDAAEPARFQRLAKVVNQSLQGCRSLSCHATTKKPQEMADLIEPKVREMEKISRQIFTLHTPMDHHPNNQVLVNRLRALSISLNSHLEGMWGVLQGVTESLWERSVEVRTRTQRLLAFYTAVAVSVTVLVALCLSWRLTVPLHQLRRGIQKVFEGDLGHSVTVKSRDEVGELASSFNYMVRRLREAQVSQEEYSRRLEEEVERKTGELREKEAQLIQADRLASLGVLASGVAHELNNPLTSILMNVNLLMEECDPQSEIFQELVKIDRDSSRCQRIINDLREFSRPRELAPRPTDLNGMAEEVLRIVGHELSLQEIQLVRRFADDLPPVSCDPDRLGQVLLNMILNAMQAMPKGGVLVVTTARRDGWAAISVSDAGPGIPQDIRHRVFDPFFTTKEKGTGLGLSISYGIIRNHGGRIEIESRTDPREGTTGTTIHILLPLKGASHAEE